MRQLTHQQLENQVNQFNSTFKVGVKVEVLKRANESETFIDEIKHEATIMGGHTAMTWLKEHGSYDLTFVRGLYQAAGERVKEELICPKCENPYPHSYTDGSYSCEECGKIWASTTK